MDVSSLEWLSLRKTRCFSDGVMSGTANPGGANCGENFKSLWRISTRARGTTRLALAKKSLVYSPLSRVNDKDVRSKTLQ